ncbi:MAG: GTP cyclohydrolase II [Ardenticatenaceae bacterium]
MDHVTIKQMVCARIPTEVGEFKLYLYRSNYDDKEHLVLVMGDLSQQPNILVRIHSECFTGDVLGSLRCDCGPQLGQAMQLIADEGVGLIIYLRQEGRGIGLLDKLRAYRLQDEGYDTVDANLMLGHDADGRDYRVAALILQDLGVQSLRLLTNNPAKIESLQQFGLHVTAREPLPPQVTSENMAYLKTKVERMRHLLTLDHTLTRSNALDHRSGPETTEVVTTSYLLPGKPPATRPFVTLTYAQSLDGSITARRGEPMAISGPESLVMTHRLRANHEAILVGIGTILADNPRLNVRLVAGSTPQAIILDSQLRFPLDANLLRHHNSPWIATTKHAEASRQHALEALGVRVLRLPANEAGQVKIEALLPQLKALGIDSLMVEGGAKVITSFLAARLVDRLIVTVAPLLVGGLNALHNLAQVPAHHFPRLRHPQHKRLGEDMVFFGDLEIGD